MTLSKLDLTNHKLYPILDEKEKVWVDNYLQYRDSLLATEAAVGRQVTRSELRRLAVGFLGSPALRKLTMWIDGEYTPTREEIIAELWKFGTKRKGSDNAKVTALQSVAEMEGYLKKGATQGAPSLTEFMKQIDSGFDPDGGK